MSSIGSLKFRHAASSEWAVATGCVTVPAVLAWAAALDPSGRFSSIAMGTYVVLPAVSPALAGMFYDRAGEAALLMLVSVTAAAFLGLVLLLGASLAVETAMGRVARDA